MNRLADTSVERRVGIRSHERPRLARIRGVQKDIKRIGLQEHIVLDTRERRQRIHVDNRQR